MKHDRKKYKDFTELLATMLVVVFAGGCVADATHDDETQEDAAERSVDQTSQALGVRNEPARIAAGTAHSLAIRQDGTVWAWGDNPCGQIGDGTANIDRLVPVPVVGMTNAIAVAAGGSHSVALRSDGTVWSWGCNDFGQLGDGTNHHAVTPVKVPILNNIVAISAGQNYAVALRSDGFVFAWGQNNLNQLGDGTNANRNLPVVVKKFASNLSNIVGISAGQYHALAVAANGRVWSWGYNAVGQLGNGTTANQSVATEAVLLDNAVTVAAGQYHSVALRANGSVAAWGYNLFGQLGDGTTTTRYTPTTISGAGSSVKRIAAGYRHTLALRSDGTVIGWGNGAAGQLGTGSSVSYLAPVQLPSLSGIEAIATGAYHSLVVGASNGIIVGFGTNANGEIGNNSTIAQYSPVTTLLLTGQTSVAGGDGHTIALRWDGTVWGWGYNFYGQLGDGTIIKRLTPVQVKDSSANSLSGIMAVSTGANHSLALHANGTVRAWGQNNFGQLGTGNNTNSNVAVQVPNLSGIVAVAAGSYHSLALRFDGTVYAWGKNDLGQLGDTTTMHRNSPVSTMYLDNVTSIAAGGNHSLATCGDGTAYAWGSGEDGQLCDAMFGAGYMSPVISQIPAITSAQAVAAGTGHTLVLQANGKVMACGDNAYGQLGVGDNMDRAVPTEVMGLNNAIRLAAGGQTSAAVASDGTAWAWGRNNYGQLGNGTTTDSTIIEQMLGVTTGGTIAVGAWHTVMARSDNTVWATGRNNFGQLGNATMTNQTGFIQSLL